MGLSVPKIDEEVTEMRAWLHCDKCDATYPLHEVRYRCECGWLLDVIHDLEGMRCVVSRETFDARHIELAEPRTSPKHSSGVWRYTELVLPVEDEEIVSRPEGNTPSYHHERLSEWVSLDEFCVKHEGENPTGSFKDRGMTVGITQARVLGARAVACASTGNTSASLAAYASMAGLPALVFIPAGHIAYGKLSQALAYGARTFQIEGDFDAAMGLVQRVCDELDIYLLNSMNPFRLEGQKTIVFELLQSRGWVPPQWIVFPAGNLGNTAAFGKALHELHVLGLIDVMPRLVAVQAEGANPFYRGFVDGFRERVEVRAETVATAIRIGAPVSYWRAVRALRWTDGLVVQVSDQEIMDAKAQVDAAGIGCEPASAAAVAGVRKLVAEAVIDRSDSVIAILTGHLLKDPQSTVNYHSADTSSGLTATYANRPIPIDASVDAVRRSLEGWL